MAIKSKSTGIPGRLTNEQQQDDLLINTRPVPVSWLPQLRGPRLSPTVRGMGRPHRVPLRDSCRLTHHHHGRRRIAHYRSSVKGGRNTRGGLFGKLFRTAMVEKVEPYWPGMFIQFHSKTDPKHDRDSAMIVVRGDSRGMSSPDR
ncbi:MAG: hypothetical protein R3C12_19520 [Planctomycetaceae bacterium]